MDQGAGRVEVHQHLDALHLRRGEGFPLQQAGGGVQGQVGAAAAGVFFDFDARFDHKAAAAQRRRGFIRVVAAAAGKGAHKPEPPLQRIGGGGEPRLHQLGGVDPGAAGRPGVIGLGHRAEVLAQARRLRRRQRYRHSRPFRGKPQQPGGRRRRAQGPQRPGGMPAQVVVVRGADGIAHGAGHLEPQQIGQQQLAAGGAGFLRQRQRPGDQGRAGVRLGDVGNVIVVQGVGHCAVDQGGVGGGGLEPAPDDGGGGRGAQSLDVAA